MSITTVTSRDFARNLAQAKKAAGAGPVIVTDRGRPTYALLKIDDDCRLSGQAPKSLLAVMDAIPDGEFEFDPLTLGVTVQSPACRHLMGIATFCPPYRKNKAL